MGSLSDAVYQRLTTDATFLSLVGTYGAAPSVFIGDVVPDGVTVGAHGPYVFIPDFTQADDDTGLELRRKQILVRIYGADGPSTDALALRTRQLLNRWRASTDQGPVIGSSASGPTKAPTSDPNVTGRLVTVTPFIQE